MALLGTMLDQAWQGVVAFLDIEKFSSPEVAVFIILVVGMVGGRILSEILRSLLKMTALDDLAVKSNVQSFLRKLDYSGTLSDLISDLTKIFIYLLVLFVVFDMLELQFIIERIDLLLNFLPRVILALSVIIVGFIASSHLENITIRIFRAGPMSQMVDETEASIPAYRFVGKFVKLTGYVATVLAALSILGVNRIAINALIAIFGLGLVAIFVVSFRDLMRNIAISLYFQLARVYAAGDMVEVDGRRGEVVSISPLYTKIKDGKREYYVPNVELVNNVVERET